MNSLQFSVLFLSSAIIGLSDGLITPIVSGLNIYLPLIGAASTASLGTILAALGALKLGAVAVVLASQNTATDELASDAVYGAPVEIYEEPKDTYGAPAHLRTRRSSANEESGSILGLVESLDKSNCAKQLVCQIHAKEVAARSQEEAVIIAMFGKAPGVAASKIPLAEFEIAAKIGASSRSDAVCQEAYTSCPYSSWQIMQLFKSL